MLRISRSLAISATLWFACDASAQTPTTAPTSTPRNAATAVTLHKQNATVADVLADLSRQAAISIENSGAASSTVNIDADGKPFWDVFADVCRQAKMGFTLNVNGDQPVLAVQKQPLGRTVSNGGVLAQFLNVRHWNRLVEADGSRDHCEIDIALTWEPKVNAIFYERIIRPTEAVDEHGKSAVGTTPPVDDPRYSRPYGVYETMRDHFGRTGNRGGQVHQMLQLQLPPDAGRSLAKLRGTLHLFAGGGDKTATIKNLKQFKTKTAVPFIKDTTLKAEDVEVRDDQIQVQFAVKKNPGESDAAWNQRRALLSTTRVVVTDASGKMWSNPRDREFVNIGWGPDTFYISASVTRDEATKSAPATLTLTAPNDVTQIDIPYDFSNLPLP